MQNRIIYFVFHFFWQENIVWFSFIFTGLQIMLGHWMELLYCSDFQASKHLIIFKLMRHPINSETELYTHPKKFEV